MNKLEELAKSTYTHEALNNEFYELWNKEKLPVNSLKIFARNYSNWVKSFPDTLAMLFANTSDSEAKIELVSTLYSEMGCAKTEKVHWKLLDYFLSNLADSIGHSGELDREKLAGMNLLESTKNLIDGERKLYTHKDSSVAAGAQLALEWQAYTMLAKLYEGVRNYKDVWKNGDEFHEACEYFYVHIGSAEKGHKEESLKAAKKYARTDAELEKVKQGFSEHLKLIAEFWKGIHQEIEKGKN